MNGTCLTGCEGGFQGELCQTRKYKPTRTQVFKCIKEYHNDKKWFNLCLSMFYCPEMSEDKIMII